MGPETYFLPAVRAYTRRKAHTSGDTLMSWATRSIHSLVPGYDVYDIVSTPSGLLIAALNLNVDSRLQNGEIGERRLVAIDPGTKVVVADTGPIDFGAVSGLELQLADVDGDGSSGVLLMTFGTGVSGRLFRLLGDRFERICSDSEDGDFHAWIGFELVDEDGDGILEVRGYLGKWANCPTCGRECQSNEAVWKLERGGYHRWTIRGDECGTSCKRPWAY